MILLSLIGTALAGGTSEEGFGSGFSERWREYRSSPGAPGIGAEAEAEVRDRMDEGEGREAGVRDAAWRAAGERAGEAREQLETLHGIVESFKELVEAYKALSEMDRAVDPNFRPPGAPDVPVSCTEGECSACYSDAQAALHHVLFRFEKLRAIYSTTTAFNRRALQFGDTSSGIHGMVGLAWQKERKIIEEGQTNLDAAYDAKRPELMEALREALGQVAACEQTHFNNPDWYDRFGFMYYQFIDEKYKR